MPTPEELRELEAASEASAAAASRLLDRELEVVMRHVSRLQELMPKTADDATYRKLIAVVEECSNRNESVAALRARVEKLGSGSVALLRDVAKLAGYAV